MGKEGQIKCVICHSPDIQKKQVEEEIKSNRDILLMPIDVLLCSSCGERYYDKKTLRRIEEMRLKFRNQGLLVEEVGRVLKERAA
jgi:YgiT-type zinc finger domain-containing protein